MRPIHTIRKFDMLGRLALRGDIAAIAVAVRVLIYLRENRP